MRVNIVLKLADQVPMMDCDYIGADKGALTLSEQKIRMISAIGDFDSVEKKDLEQIRSYSDEMICLNPIKNDSDSEAALKYALEKGYDEIAMYGAFGGRMDHSYYNIRLAFLYPNCLTLYDSYNKVYALKKGIYQIKKEDYPYISFFTDSKAMVTLKGFEYTLDHYKMDQNTIFTLSNSILKEEATLIIEEGLLLVLQTRDKQ